MPGFPSENRTRKVFVQPTFSRRLALWGHLALAIIRTTLVPTPARAATLWYNGN